MEIWNPNFRGTLDKEEIFMRGGTLAEILNLIQSGTLDKQEIFLRVGTLGKNSESESEWDAR